MTTLTVTARGQVTFRKEVLKHPGIRPGDRIRLDLLPDGRAEMGLRVLDPGGDFADGVLPTTEAGLVATHLSHLTSAISLLARHGHRARLLAPKP